MISASLIDCSGRSCSIGERAYFARVGVRPATRR